MPDSISYSDPSSQSESVKSEYNNNLEKISEENKSKLSLSSER